MPSLKTCRYCDEDVVGGGSHPSCIAQAPAVEVNQQIRVTGGGKHMYGKVTRIMPTGMVEYRSAFNQQICLTHPDTVIVTSKHK
jgi:hypothetical protein